MLEELKKPIEDLITKGKDAVLSAGKEDGESNAFFEKLADTLSKYTGHTVVENKELQYDKNYKPEEEKHE